MNPETRRRVSWPAIVALALVPLLAVAALIGLTGNHDDRVSAAVVNLDEAVTVNDQYIPMGRQLAAAMIDREGENISWTLADAPSAAAGLKSGKYSAVVTIPKGFSAAATSFSENDADTAKQATIEVKVSDNAPITDADVAQQIARIATDTINTTLTSGYLDGIYVGFNTVGEQFTTIVDGASQLSDGAGKLSEGVTQAGQGVNQLNAGMAKLKEGAPQLIDGGEQLVEGIGTLGQGATQLADGVDEFAAQTPQLVDGVGKLADGGRQINTGVVRLDEGASQFADGVDQFAAQAPAMVDGVNQLATQGGQLLEGLPAFANGAAQVVQGTGQLKGGLDEMIRQLDAGSAEVGGLEEFADGARSVADGAADLSDGLSQASQGLTQAGQSADAVGGQIAQGVMQGFTCPAGLDEASCQALTGQVSALVGAGASAGFSQGIDAGLEAVDASAQGAAALAGGTDDIATGAEQLATGLEQQMDTMLTKLRGGLVELRDGAAQLVTGGQPIVDNAPAIADGATQLKDGLDTLNAQIGALPAGVGQLSTGARQLADGLSELRPGVAQLSGGLDTLDSQVGALPAGVEQLSTGARQLADGVGDLETGAGTYVDGVNAFATGAGSAADGTAELADGFVALDEGAAQLSDGLDTFATELAKGADQVPSYSTGEREQLAKVVSAPIERSDALIAGAQIPAVSLLLAAALWLGALASFVVTRPVPRDVVTSRASSAALWLRTLWLPLSIVGAQGLVLGLVGGIVLDAGVGKTAGLMALLAVTGASFVLANHALAGWFGNVGRAVSALLLIVTIALGLSSAASWLSPVGAVSPLQNAFELIRTWLSGGSGEVGLAAVAVLMFAVAGLASVLAIATRRKLTAAQFRKAA